MTAHVVQRGRDRVVAASILVVLLASAFFFWLGIPILVLWGLAKATQSRVTHYVLGLITAPVAMAAFAPILFWLNRVYMRTTGRLLEEEPPRGWRRGLRGPLEHVLVFSLLVSIVALTVGEIPFLVSMMPWTIHGCRPLSVSSQPAVFMANGSTALQIATHRNIRDVSSFLTRPKSET